MDLSFISKTQVLGKGPKCLLSCTIPTLNCHLSNGMAEDRLLFPIWALRFYLERSRPWGEHKRLLFVSFKPGHKRDIVPSTISGWIQKTIVECYTNFPTPLLESHKVKAHQVPSMAASLADTQLFTDASNIGWGAHWNALTVSGVWTTTEKTLYINVFELEAIHRAMLHWLRKLMGLTVLVASDNSTVVSYINNQGGTRSIQLCRQTKKLLMCQANLIVLRARHIPGRLNVLADILSCPSQMSGTVWSLHPSEHGNREFHYWICLQRH